MPKSNKLLLMLKIAVVEETASAPTQDEDVLDEQVAERIASSEATCKQVCIKLIFEGCKSWKKQCQKQWPNVWNQLSMLFVTCVKSHSAEKALCPSFMQYFLLILPFLQQPTYRGVPTAKATMGM